MSCKTFPSIDRMDEDELCDLAFDLLEENAKLRELCSELWQWERFGCGACNLISLDDCQTDLYSADCLMREAFPDRMRDLGIEVDG